MTNAELMNKVMTEEELDIVAGGGPRVRVPLRGPSFKQLKDVTGAIHNAKKVITCLIKKFSPKDQVLRQYPAPTNFVTDEMRKIDKLVMGVYHLKNRANLKKRALAGRKRTFFLE